MLRTRKRYSLHLYLGPTILLGLAGRRPAWPSDDDDDDDDCYDYHLYCPELLPFEEPFEELQAPV